MGGLRQAGAAFGYRDFRRFWLGAVINSIGNWMQNVTVPYVLLQLTHSGLWVGLAVVGQILPSVALNPLAGVLADRFSRRSLLLVSNTIQGTAAFGLWVVWGTGVRSPTAMLVLVAIGGTAMMTTQPAWQALVTDIVPPEHLLNAVTLNSAQANTARAVGPAIAGIILGTLGAGWAFLLNGFTFVAVLVMLTRLRTDRPSGASRDERVLEQFREAASFARGQLGLRTAYVATVFVCGVGYPVFTLAAIFAERVYHVGPGWYGVLTGTYGAGAVVGAVLLGTIGHGRTRGQLLAVALTAQGLATIGFGLAPTLALGAPMLAIVGGAALWSIATLNTSVQMGAPERLRGRVLGLWVLCYAISYPAGALAEGALSDRIGVGPTVALAGGLITAAAVWLWAHPDVARSVNGPADLVVADPLATT